MSNDKKYKLTPQEDKLLKKMFWRTWFLGGSFNMVKMMSYGYAMVMIPAIDYFYKDKEDKIKALVRSCTFFNCTYEVTPFVLGLNTAMEKQNSEHPDFDAESMNAVKASLMGPLSGIGDSIFNGTLRLLAASIAIPPAMKGSILGAISFLAIYHIPAILTRYNLLYLGYTAGEKFLTKAFKSGMFEKITYSATTVGMMMIGAMAATSITITTPLQISYGGKDPVVIQDVLNNIMPGLIPLIVLFITFYLIRKKVKIVYLLLGIIVVGILGSMISIF